MQNGVGVVVAGAALGLWALSRREREEVETELTKRLKAQGSDLQQLKAQVAPALDQSHILSLCLCFVFSYSVLLPLIPSFFKVTLHWVQRRDKRVFISACEGLWVGRGHGEKCSNACEGPGN